MVVKDRSKLSHNPENIRKRLRRGAQNQTADVAMLASYRKPIEEWDIEELSRGRPRCKDGSFKGPIPKWITGAVVREAKRRLQLMAFDKLSAHVGNAIDVLANIMTSSEVDEDGRPIVDARTRLHAATLVIEHVIGKPRTRVEFEAADNLRAMLAKALVLPGGAPAHPIIEGTAQWGVDEDDDE